MRNPHFRDREVTDTAKTIQARLFVENLAWIFVGRRSPGGRARLSGTPLLE